jgi:3-oxoadipate CoA-transferase beta subunit
MDLAVGAREVRVLMDHVGKNGEPRIRHRCTLPLTASGVVKRIYTNLAVIDVQPDGLLVREMVGGISTAKVQSLTEPKLQFAANLQILALPLAA